MLGRGGEREVAEGRAREREREREIKRNGGRDRGTKSKQQY